MLMQIGESALLLGHSNCGYDVIIQVSFDMPVYTSDVNAQGTVILALSTLRRVCVCMCVCVCLCVRLLFTVLRYVLESDMFEYCQAAYDSSRLSMKRI